MHMLNIANRKRWHTMTEVCNGWKPKNRTTLKNRPNQKTIRLLTNLFLTLAPRIEDDLFKDTCEEPDPLDKEERPLTYVKKVDRLAEDHLTMEITHQEELLVLVLHDQPTGPSRSMPLTEKSYGSKNHLPSTENQKI